MIINKYLTKVNFEKRPNKVNQYIVVHFTANDGDTAKGNCTYFHNANRGASAHYFVDETSIYQCVLDNDVAWHCGARNYVHSKCRNTNSIGIEMCSKKDKNGVYYFDSRTINNTIELIKELMTKYNIKIDNVIRHYDVTGKLCPAPLVNTDKWTEFKDKLIEREDTEVITEGKAIVNGKQYKIDRILKDGTNYVKVANFKNMGFDIDYDNDTKAVKIDNKVKKLKLNVNNESAVVGAINIKGSNFVSLRDICRVLGKNVDYENGEINIE